MYRFDLSDALRTTGLLPYVVSIAAKWPAEDVPNHVAVAAMWVLAHASAGNAGNQTALGAAGACELALRCIVACVVEVARVGQPAGAAGDAADGKAEDDDSGCVMSGWRAGAHEATCVRVRGWVCVWAAAASAHILA